LFVRACVCVCGVVWCVRVRVFVYVYFWGVCAFFCMYVFGNTHTMVKCNETVK